MTQEADIRVLLVDDHQMVRQGLIFFLSTQPGIEVVGEAGTAQQAIDRALDIAPNVILLDMVLPDDTGIKVIETIHRRQPDTAVIVLSSFVDDEKVSAAIEAGAAGYLMKDVDPIELAEAIRATQRGELYLHREAARKLAEVLRPDAEEPQEPLPSVLTEREREVLRLITYGQSNHSIANTLYISLKTVKAHVSSILQKLNLESRVQAALYALRHHLVQLDDL